MELRPSRDYTEIGYLEFYNGRLTLSPGTYRVTEADGDVSFAVLDNRTPPGSLTEWMSEDEYHHAMLMDSRVDEALLDSWDSNRDSELFDREVYGIEPDELFGDDDREELMDSWDSAMALVQARPSDRDVATHISPEDFAEATVDFDKPQETELSLADLLREHHQRIGDI